MMKQSLLKPQRREAARLKKLTAFEQRARRQGYQYIAGVDEAGRGPLAGPVVAGRLHYSRKLLSSRDQ